MYSLVINGVTHRVTRVGGKIVYDPPLDREFEKTTNARLREMLRTRAVPRTMTDREFFQGMGTLADQYRKDPEGLNDLIRAAKSQGYTPSPHDVYVDGLASRLGDPDAFVPPSGGRGHIKKVCQKKGLGCRGVVNIEPPAPTRDYAKHPKKLLGDDIVSEEVGRLKRNPGNARRKDAELRDEVIQKHALKL